MRTARMPAFVAGAVFAVVVGGGTAVAATGGSFILGRSNSAGATSTLTNTAGTALALNSAAGTPSLRVNRSAKVPSLNGDLLDGLDSTNFGRASAGTGVFSFSGALQPGTNDTIVAFADCPAGTQMTGGGGEDLTATGTMFVSAPVSQASESWVVVVFVDPNAAESPADVTASVVCLNPRGPVAGGSRTSASPVRELSPRLAAKVAAKAAAAKAGTR
jgi:hypothetical protein